MKMDNICERCKKIRTIEFVKRLENICKNH